ncbi:MAG: hypothetical protein J2P17_23220 [Mycobacterium sp.]|nr:hypothetical protein [Mycobacterium sp.]
MTRPRTELLFTDYQLGMWQVIPKGLRRRSAAWFITGQYCCYDKKGSRKWVLRSALLGGLPTKSDARRLAQWHIGDIGAGEFTLTEHARRVLPGGR